MIQINLITITEFFKKYLGWIIAIVLLLIMINCNRSSGHSEIIKERDAKNKKLELKVDSLVKANKSKDKLIAKSEKVILEKEQIIIKLNEEIAKEKAKGKKNIAIQSKYNLKDWKKYYQEKTNFGDKDISIVGNTLNFTREPLISIGKELVQSDVVKAELKITSQVLIETKDIVVEKDKIIEEQEVKIVNLSMINETHNSIEKNLLKNVDDLKQDLKKANKPKIKTIVVSIIAGVITGIIITK